MNNDLFFKGDGILKFFFNWRENRRLRKYVRFLKADIHPLHRTSYEADKVVSKSLNNDEKFCFWNNNFWYSWASHGQIGNDYWDGNDSSRATRSIIQGLCSNHSPNKILYSPTRSCVKGLRNYLLSIDPNIFFSHFHEDIDSNYEKTYDLKEFNRDQKLQKILNG
jgi:hypothetical protein